MIATIDSVCKKTSSTGAVKDGAFHDRAAGNHRALGENFMHNATGVIKPGTTKTAVPSKGYLFQHRGSLPCAITNRLWSGVLGVAFLLVSMAVPAQVQTLDKVAAIVDDDIILASELQERLGLIQRNLEQRNIELPPDDVLIVKPSTALFWRASSFNWPIATACGSPMHSSTRQWGAWPVAQA